MPLTAILLALQQAALPTVAPDTTLLRHANGRVPRTVVATRVTDPPNIDGRLDDGAWRLATPVGGFRQIDPNEGELASESTLVWIVYDDDAIYVGARMFDSEPHRVERRLGRRDGFLDSDMFFVNFDSYHDHRTAFEFAVTPTGVKQDDITSNDFFFGDRSWDPVWEVQTSIDSLGWVAEMRIPFSQIRFPPRDEQLWGVQFFRNVFRKNETSMLEFVGKTETGYASRFAHLVGIRGIPQPRRLEILPYSVARATARPVGDPNDPFDESREYFGGAGADLKYGVTSSLTLDATVNPDFGQVEADPAFVNLSAFEQFLSERRPFFVEGANIFDFGGGSGFIRFGGTPQYFYSRRIGQPPHGFPAGPDSGSLYVDRPTASTILGAGKLTGKTANGWSVGVLDAVTAREFATADSNGVRYRDEVEPFTNYFVARLRREFRGTTGVGLLGTAVHRDLGNPNLRFLHSHAYALAGDFFHRWQSNTYSLSGSVGTSLVKGDPAALQETQLSSARYFQRPDQDNIRYDPARTSLWGASADLQISKDGGSTNWAFGASTSSPGFEVNDLGFQTRVDRISGAAFLGHRWTRPGKVFRQASLSTSGGPSWNYDGDLIGANIGIFQFGQFHNYWGYNVNLGYSFRAMDDRLTRGGPVTAEPAEFRIGAGFFSDGRKRVNGNLFVFHERTTAGAWFLGFFPGISVRPTSAIELSVEPNVTLGRGVAQFVRQQPDPLATATFGRRYVFASIERRSADITLRMNYTMSPVLSLQLYVQPFTFRGDYDDYKELVAPRTFDFLVYGRDGASESQTVVDGATGRTVGFVVDPDGAGQPAPSFFVDNLDFTVSSFQSNAVLRWEYRPGSTLFVVWTIGRGSFRSYDATAGVGDELTDLLLFRRARPTHTLQLKLNYWLSL